MYSYRVRDGSLTDVVRNHDRAAMIRKLHELIVRPGIAENAPLADALERHMRLVADTHYSYAVKHAVTKGQVRNLSSQCRSIVGGVTGPGGVATPGASYMPASGPSCHRCSVETRKEATVTVLVGRMAS